jgi:hypothetical protein
MVSSELGVILYSSRLSFFAASLLVEACHCQSASRVCAVVVICSCIGSNSHLQLFTPK